MNFFILEIFKQNNSKIYPQNYPIFVTNETTSPDLGSPIISVSTVNAQLRPPNDLDEHFERFSETSSIELIIQGGYDQVPQAVSQDAVKVPDSRTLQFNPYPGSKSKGNVPVDIVKSFTPVLTHEEQKVQDGADIYSDYIQDPYNLTLQIDDTSSNVVRNDSVPSASTIFQSSSYFSNDTSDPSAELFNRP